MTETIDLGNVPEQLIWQIPEQNIGYLTDKIEKLNKRAKKLGVALVTMHDHGSEVVETDKCMICGDWKDSQHGRDHQFQPTIRVLHQIEIRGEAPKLNGWKFCAVVQQYEEGNLVKTVPGQTVPEMYRTTDPYCDHCQHNRYRKEVYIVENEEKEFKQVGSSCLKDFLGHADPLGYARWAEMLADLALLGEALEDYEYGGGDALPLYHIESYLEIVSAVINRFGWVSRGQARYEYNKTATADIAMSIMTSKPSHLSPDERLISEQGGSTQDKKLVHDALEWFETWRNDDLTGNDYLWNLKIAVGRGVVDGKTSGLVASLISAYMRHMEREIKRARKAKTAEKSQWIGEIKKREDFILTVTGVQPIENQYDPYGGATYLYSFLEGDGNIVKWFASSPQPMAVGETYKLKATVKKHEEWNDIHQTLINRGKVLCMIDIEGKEVEIDESIPFDQLLAEKEF